MDGVFGFFLGIGVMVFLIYAGDGLSEYLKNKKHCKCQTKK